VAHQLIYDYRAAELTEEDAALCRFAEKLTRTPGAMEQADVEQLRATGLTDEQITIATQVISYFNYINRIADALGVAPESWMPASPDEWHASRGRDYLATLATPGTIKTTRASS
jgi:uncharacterized protein YciW